MIISFIIPAYNEEQNISAIYGRIKSVINTNYSYEILFIDDGSTDGTLKEIIDISTKENNVHYISFSRNFGHQSALKAGIVYATGDAIIMLDADLEHPPELINELINHWKEGYDIVLTKRAYESHISFFKKITSYIFYNMLNYFSDIRLEEGFADFRLIDKKVQKVICNNPENDLFLRGYIAWMGFNQKIIPYVSGKRKSGKSKYNLKRMFDLALTGLTSFSIKPFRLALIFGLLLTTLSFVSFPVYLILKILTGLYINKWPLILLVILFISGLQFSLMGLLGEYITKILRQVKGRPPYIIDDMDNGLKQRFNPY
jgi:glycosyltransferase involved in cell wall biosynthesis